MATEHSTITSTDCHEPKYMTTATTADTGKVLTPSSSTNGVSELRLLTAGDISESGRTKWAGWGKWADSTYTSGSKLAITGTTRTQITIDGLGTQTNVSQIPSLSNDWWDTSTNKIVPDNDFDGYEIRLNFKADTASASSYFTVELDIGGSIGTIIEEIKVFSKGTSTTHPYVFSWPVYTGTTFNANGGTLYLTPSTNQNFWDFEIEIHKTYSGA